jgi:transposase
MRALQHPSVSGKAERSAGQAQKEGTVAMEKYIGCDSHQRYSVFVTMDEKGEAGVPVRVEHDKKELQKFLRTLPAGAAVAVEASGGWYWFVDALEEAGLKPHLANPLEAKKHAGAEQDRQAGCARIGDVIAGGHLAGGVDSAGRTPGSARTDARQARHASSGVAVEEPDPRGIRRYGLRQDAFRDPFAGKARVALSGYIDSLPVNTRFATAQEWRMLDQIERHIERMEVRIREGICKLGWVRLLKTLPGVGEILGATIHLEIGDVKRFPTAAHLAAYAGLVPSVHSSGGKTHYGPTSKQANHYLKWAFIEAANATVAHRDKYGEQHVGQLYRRLKERKCHGKAATAVARHLAESSWWILNKKQQYRAPHAGAVSSSNNG